MDDPNRLRVFGDELRRRGHDLLADELFAKAAELQRRQRIQATEGLRPERFSFSPEMEADPLWGAWGGPRD